VEEFKAAMTGPTQKQKIRADAKERRKKDKVMTITLVALVFVFCVVTHSDPHLLHTLTSTCGSGVTRHRLCRKKKAKALASG
jgi:hypothetical protein